MSIALSHTHDPETSNSAIPAREKRRLVKNALLEIIRVDTERFGLAAFEVSKIYFANRVENGWPDIQPYSINRRLSELHMAGEIRDTDVRIPAPSGKNVAVWAINEGNN